MKLLHLAMACQILTACASASVQSDASAARAEIQTVLRRMEDAARKKDAEAFTVADSVITITTPDGRSMTRSRAELVDDQRQRWAAVLETKQIQLTLDSLRVRGDTAIVFTRQLWERIIRDPQGQEHTRLTQATHRETWIRRSDGWHTRAVQILSQGPNLTDGRPQ